MNSVPSTRKYGRLHLPCVPHGGLRGLTGDGGRAVKHHAHAMAERSPSTLPCPAAIHASALEAATPAFLDYSSRHVLSDQSCSPSKVPVMVFQHHLDFLTLSFLR